MSGNGNGKRPESRWSLVWRWRRGSGLQLLLRGNEEQRRRGTKNRKARPRRLRVLRLTQRVLAADWLFSAPGGDLASNQKQPVLARKQVDDNYLVTSSTVSSSNSRI